MTERRSTGAGIEGMLKHISFEASDPLRSKVEGMQEDGVISAPRFHATGPIVLDRQMFIGRAHDAQLDIIEAIMKEEAKTPFRIENVLKSTQETPKGMLTRLAFYPDEESSVRLNQVVKALGSVNGRIDLDPTPTSNFIICQFATSTLAKNEARVNRAFTNLTAALPKPGTYFDLHPKLAGKEVTMRTISVDRPKR